MNWLKEFVYPDFAQMLRYDELVHRRTTAYQTIGVYQTRLFGRILVIDDAVQLTEADNHIYHEMLVHVPILAHGSVAEVLVIGGGDGGVLREVLKHPVRSATLVEIDPEVVEVSKRYFPQVSGGAFDDARVDVVYADAAVYLKTCERVFDLIIIDSTDPVGPGGALFTSGFYGECRRVLRSDGAIVLQGGMPIRADRGATDAVEAFQAAFGDFEEYIVTVPSYPMGMLVLRGKGLGQWALASDRDTLEKRLKQAGVETLHYSPQTHKAAFDVFPQASRQRCAPRVLTAPLTPPALSPAST